MKRLSYGNTQIGRTLRYIWAVQILFVVMSLSAGKGATVTIYPNNISATATVTQESSIELRGARHGGFRDSERSKTEALDWYQGGLTNGGYRHDVFVMVGHETDEGVADTTRLYRENSRFRVKNGTISHKEEAVMPPLPDVEDQTSLDSGTWYETLASNLLDFLAPPAAAGDLITNPGDLYITDYNPYIYWDDTNTTGTDWNIWGNYVNFCIYDAQNLKVAFYADINPAFGTYEYSYRFFLYNYKNSWYSISLDEDSGPDVLYADANGDIELADGAVFIDKSANNLGVGTMTPSENIHVASTVPSFLLDTVSGGDITMINGYGEVSFTRTNGAYNGEFLTFENELASGLYPGIGIWQPNPKVPLHVGSHDGMSAGLLVENPTAPTAAGDVVMFNLRNTGDKIVRFAIQAGGGTSIWTFDNEPTYNGGAGINSGRFRVAKSGTGVTEFSVDGYGNGRFYGTSYAINHVNTSSREAKTDFETLNEQDVLNRLMRLPVSQWRYKQDGQASRHIGPVAEDFQQAFGLGDGRHISTVDSEGIALAAIKAVKSEKDSEIAALREEKNAEIAALKAEKDAEIVALKAERDAEFAVLREEEEVKLSVLTKQNLVLTERLSALESLLLNQQPISAR